MFLHQNDDAQSHRVRSPGEYFRPSALRCLLLLLALGLSSCAGARFEREWKRGSGQKAQDLTGNWEGKWQSQSNGHTGRLRCIVKPVENRRDEYSFQYQAFWGRFLQGVFTIQCRTLRTDPQQWKVSGSKNLGKLLGGEFSHQVEITPQAIHAKYHSQLDHGVMDLRRSGSGEISTKSASPGH